MSFPSAVIIGGGLAGCEAAFALASFGIRVTLYEMKPMKFSPAHKNADLAELVCSNSFKALRQDSAAGLLKEEMRLLRSLCLKTSDQCAVPSGGALAVDRVRFSRKMTEAVSLHPLITVIRDEVTSLPEHQVTVIATGPLTSDAFAEYLRPLVGEELFFFDAVAPIVTAESVDMSHAFFASRYGKGGQSDYLNCPLSREEYEAFYRELVSARCAPVHGCDADFCVYEGCMPIETLASRGEDAIRFGPMKPVGLTDPATGRRPWAVVQLRAEDAGGSLRNLVGFQTRLAFSEQRRVFGMVPALQNAEYVRYGVMHRNTYLHSPRLLKATFQMKTDPLVFFAGQITGVEGYMESAVSGIIAGINAAAVLLKTEPFLPPPETVTGALCRYISGYRGTDFQPMGANFGILPPLHCPVRDKRARYSALGERGIAAMKAAINGHPLLNRSM